MIINTEEYTSKTCGRCGTIGAKRRIRPEGYINEVGSKDIFTCNKCKLVVDRDVNGARNIYIKTINKILC
jgi:transposase